MSMAEQQEVRASIAPTRDSQLRWGAFVIVLIIIGGAVIVNTEVGLQDDPRMVKQFSGESSSELSATNTSPLLSGYMIGHSLLAMLSAAMRLNIPAVLVYGGPMEDGKTKLSKNELNLIDAMVIAPPHMTQIGS
jgi:hypothetical protein